MRERAKPGSPFFRRSERVCTDLTCGLCRHACIRLETESRTNGSITDQAPAPARCTPMEHRRAHRSATRAALDLRDRRTADGCGDAGARARLPLTPRGEGGVRVRPPHTPRRHLLSHRALVMGRGDRGGGSDGCTTGCRPRICTLPTDGRSHTRHVGGTWPSVNDRRVLGRAQPKKRTAPRAWRHS